MLRSSLKAGMSIETRRARRTGGEEEGVSSMDEAAARVGVAPPYYPWHEYKKGHPPPRNRVGPPNKC